MQRRVVHDCARRVRVRYTLPHPLDESLGEHFPRGEVTLQPFSKLVAGARDHLTITVGGGLLLRGAVGDNELEATYGKVTDVWPRSLISIVEARIEDYAAQG